jgi:hypothetical protein
MRHLALLGLKEGPYPLRAYPDGKRYEVEARNLGDWYDVRAMLGLMNALLQARQSEQRLVELSTTDQMTHVLGGPRAGIQELVDARLITLGGGDEGMKEGKAFEERVAP